jgi:hypothetical protein
MKNGFQHTEEAIKQRGEVLYSLTFLVGMILCMEHEYIQ